ncbi:MAG: hypothetical protein AB7M12_09560 [Hyphomonadaceae bacterium]
MDLFRFEDKGDALAPPHVFLGRMAASILAAALITAFSLALGMAGYRYTEHMGWLDAFLNAAMLLGGMGPVSPLASDAGKVFAGAYALFCGLVIVVTTGVVLAPVLHRVLHAFHVEDDA